MRKRPRLRTNPSMRYRSPSRAEKGSSILQSIADSYHAKLFAMLLSAKIISPPIMGCGPGSPTALKLCDKDADCKKNQICINDTCTSQAPKPPDPCEPKQEVCDGKDNDCDGQIDEGLTRPKNPVGACEPGEETCTNGKWQETKAPIIPKPEVCDGQDNDCDGQIDNNIKPVPVPSPDGCAPGEKTCVDGTMQVTKNPGIKSPEVCDGKDNDCDGQIDNKPGTQDPLSKSSYSGPDGTQGVGECKERIEVCENGSWKTTQQEKTPTQPQCNEKDNDCDGKPDVRMTITAKDTKGQPVSVQSYTIDSSTGKPVGTDVAQGSTITMPVSPNATGARIAGINSGDVVNMTLETPAACSDHTMPEQKLIVNDKGRVGITDADCSQFPDKAANVDAQCGPFNFRTIIACDRKETTSPSGDKKTELSCTTSGKTPSGKLGTLEPNFEITP